MPAIQYPNVPNVPGVPQLLRKFPSGPPSIVSTNTGIASLARLFIPDSRYTWGIFKHVDKAPPVQGVTTLNADGTATLPALVVTAKLTPAVTPDSHLDFDQNQEWSVTTAPTQQGAFADYNRVASPFEIKLRMTKGGSLSDRKKFLQQIDDLGTTQLYDIFTPEKVYRNCNFVRSEISRRGEKGAYWLSMVDAYFREIRPVVATYSKTTILNPTTSDASQQQNNGTQQGVATTATPAPSVTK